MSLLSCSCTFPRTTCPRDCAEQCLACEFARSLGPAKGPPMTTPPDRRATITEGDRSTTARLILGLAASLPITVDQADKLAQRIAQAIADTREAAEARASILVRALEETQSLSIHPPNCSEPHGSDCNCHREIASRALAEYAEAGAKKP